MNTEERHSVVIIGIGNALRRDDGVGPLMLDACKYDPIPGCDLVELDGEASRIIDAWCCRDLAIVVDAVCTGDEAGTLHDLSLDQLGDARAAQTATSSHFAGLAEALELGRTLDRLPKKLRVLGIEPGDLKHGFGLSAPVAAAMEDLETLVREAATQTNGQPVD